mgnify:CR=1 FL=1
MLRSLEVNRMATEGLYSLTKLLNHYNASWLINIAVFEFPSKAGSICFMQHIYSNFPLIFQGENHVILLTGYFRIRTLSIPEFHVVSWQSYYR